MTRCTLGFLAACIATAAFAQEAKPAPQPPSGTVLIQSHGEPPSLDPDADATDALPPADLKLGGAELTDADRAALRIDDYNLDIRLRPADHSIMARARLRLTNTSAVPLARLALQISSSLRWDSISLAGKPLPLAQHLLDTDADHTGRAAEAVVTLPAPLAPGASILLDTFYTGTLAADAGRLLRIGAQAAQARQTDWDVVGADPGSLLSVALRGFGNVLWLPVSHPQVFLGDGAELFHAIGAQERDQAASTVRLRLTLEYTGRGPAAAYFCGLRAEFTASGEDATTQTGVAIANFGGGSDPLHTESLRIGFRPMSLFVLDQPETRLAPLPGVEDAPMLAVASDDAGAFPRLAESAEHLAPLVQRWFGPRPLTALTILDHSGAPFEDGPLVVAPLAALAGSSSAAALTEGLTHAWVATGQPWMDTGLAQFLSLLLTEQEQGRDRAVAELDDLLQPLTLAEPGAENFSPVVKTSGQPLIAATDEIYYRRKAAAVWWMLRDLAGEQPLRQALSAWRLQPVSTAPAEDQARAFEHLLERTSGKDLAWFFDDWILRDRGLPDLTIVSVVPRQLPPRTAHDTSWLVSVTVRNEGAATAEVPLIIRSGSFSTTRSLRVPGLSDVTERILVETAPTEVVLNDGSVPEVRSSRHSRDVVIKTQ